MGLIRAGSLYVLLNERVAYQRPMIYGDLTRIVVVAASAAAAAVRVVAVVAVVQATVIAQVPIYLLALYPMR